MPYHDVCVPGRPAGGRVREDDPHGSIPAAHDAGGPSPGILQFVRDVVRNTPAFNYPPKPAGFPVGCRVDTYPGRSKADVHFEGRAADIYLDYATQQAYGDWLFDWCVQNCDYFKIQGVIWGTRKWYSEVNGGREFPYNGGDHNNHVHVELNCDGASHPPGLVGAPGPGPPTP